MKNPQRIFETPGGLPVWRIDQKMVEVIGDGPLEHGSLVFNSYLRRMRIDIANDDVTEKEVIKAPLAEQRVALRVYYNAFSVKVALYSKKLKKQFAIVNFKVYALEHTPKEQVQSLVDRDPQTHLNKIIDEELFLFIVNYEKENASDAQAES